MYAGIGYDVHRFAKGRKLILGGVEIINPKGLSGHSDADVLVHAIMDAVLGAAGMDDIGHLFPNNDPRYKNISSLKLLAEVIKKLEKKHFRVFNIDVAVIAERPKIAAHTPKMKKNLSEIMHIPSARIGIKATTNEGMGFIGRGEGIAALATAMLKKK